MPPISTLMERDQMSDPSPHTWLTVNECAELFRVSPKTVYRHLAAGTLPVRSMRIGRQWRLSAVDAVELLGAIQFLLATAVEVDDS